MYKKILQILSLSLLLVSFLNASGSKPEDEVDHLALATLMIYDARYDKAEEELALVDTKSAKYDKANYFTVVGVLNSKQTQTKKAIEAYQQAIKATKTK